MIERGVSGIEFDIGRRDDEANVLNKEISNRQIEIIKTKTDVGLKPSHKPIQHSKDIVRTIT